MVDPPANTTGDDPVFSSSIAIEHCTEMSTYVFFRMLMISELISKSSIV